MGVLILLIVIDLLIIGIMMYFVMSEKPTHREHYVPPEPAEQQEAREWAVQTTSDAEAAPVSEAAESAAKEAEALSEKVEALEENEDSKA